MANQKLFNFLSDNGFVPLESDMDEIRKIVFENEVSTEGKTEQQIRVEAFIIEVMPKIQQDLLKITENVFKAEISFSERQMKLNYTLPKDILCLGLQWLAFKYGPPSPSGKREMNKLKKYIGTY